MALNNGEQLGKLPRPELWQTERQEQSTNNVNDSERVVSLLGGAALGLVALTRGGILKWPLLAAASGGIYRGVTGRSSIYTAFKINTNRQGSGSSATVEGNKAIKVKRSITINKPVAEIYQFWRNFANLPKFMEHLEEVTVSDEKHSHWVAKAPVNTKVEWDAEIINEKENELIAWKSLAGAAVPNAGSVQFKAAPGNRGTEVIVEIDYQPPAGIIGTIFAKLFGEEPLQTVQEDLRHLKAQLEAGEIVTTKGQPSGRSA